MSWDLDILEGHKVAAHSCKQLFFAHFSTWTSCRLPIFKLPLVPAAKYTHHSPPLSFAETLGSVINIEGDLPLIYHPFDLDGLGLVCRVISNVVTFLQKLLNVSNTK